jgi:tRNA G18 (ribose-2'-O)-methylase SpoU
VIEHIEHQDDPRLADYFGLTDVTRRLKHEPENGFFIAEGQLVMRRAIEAGIAPRSILLAPNRVEDLLPELRDLDCTTYTASYEVMHAVTGFHVHRGALGSFGRPAVPAPEEVLATAQRVLVLENVNSPTNLGAVFRSAAGLGMDAVLLSPNCCDPLYRRAVRVSMGEVFALPYAYLEEFPRGITQVQEGGFRVLAMTPGATTDLGGVTIEGRTAILLGAEGPGLTEEAMAASDLEVAISMAGGVDSLNIAAAAAVACWVVGRRPVQDG